MFRQNGSLFLVLEGMNGAGKSTMVERLKAHYLDGGFPCFDKIVTTYEIGGTYEGKHIRQLFSNFIDSKMDGCTELLLINAARRHHLQNKIIPALSENATLVVCDRYLPSTYAFQCGWRGVSETYVSSMHQRFCYGIMPDHTIFFKIKPETSIQRTANRKIPLPDNYRTLEVLKNVYDGYNEWFLKFPEDYSCIDAEMDEELVWQKVLDAIKPVLPKDIIE